MRWRGDECELADGVKQGIETVAQRLHTQPNLVDQWVGPFQFRVPKQHPTSSFPIQGLQHGSLETLKVD